MHQEAIDEMLGDDPPGPQLNQTLDTEPHGHHRRDAERADEWQSECVEDLHRCLWDRAPHGVGRWLCLLSRIENRLRPCRLLRREGLDRTGCCTDQADHANQPDYQRPAARPLVVQKLNHWCIFTDFSSSTQHELRSIGGVAPITGPTVPMG